MLKGNHYLTNTQILKVNQKKLLSQKVAKIFTLQATQYKYKERLLVEPSADPSNQIFKWWATAHPTVTPMKGTATVWPPVTGMFFKVKTNLSPQFEDTKVDLIELFIIQNCRLPTELSVVILLTYATQHSALSHSTLILCIIQLLQYADIDSARGRHLQTSLTYEAPILSDVFSFMTHPF